MTTLDIEMRHLAAFVAVAEELHYGRAATRLHMAQPPLSRQIVQLERRLGVQLLRRTKHRVELTEAGRAFLEEARATLCRLEQAARMAQRTARGEVGRLRLGHVDAASFELLPGLLRVFHRHAPDVHLVVEESTTSRLVQALRDGSLDVAFVRPPVVDDALEGIDVLDEPLMVALPDTHRLAGDDRVELAELAKDPFVVPPRAVTHAMHDRVLEVCRGAGFEPDIVEEAFPTSSIVLLVSAGCGVALLPAAVSGHFRQQGMVYRPLADPVPTIGLGLAWRAGESSPVVHAFVRVVREATNPPTFG